MRFFSTIVPEVHIFPMAKTPKISMSKLCAQHEKIKEICEELAIKYDINFVYRDFRPGFREGQAKARELGLYMQKYCGCIFSEEDRYSKQIEKEKQCQI